MEDYKSAALRHYEDAERLKVAGCLDNAGHLVGFAAECSLKYKIASIRPTGDSPHGHLPDFILTARRHLRGRADVNAMSVVIKGDIFEGWNVNRRYHATGTTSQQELDSWFTSARRLLGSAGIRR